MCEPLVVITILLARLILLDEAEFEAAVKLLCGETTPWSQPKEIIMTAVAETFLPQQMSPRISTTSPTCTLPMPHFPNPQWELIQEALASRVAMQSVMLQLPMVLKLPIADQEAFVSDIFEDLKCKGLLSSEDIDSLRGVSEGRVFNVAVLNPDGSPSLCGVLGRFMTPSPERDIGGAIAGAAMGAACGAAVGGPGGAAIGALAGGLAGHFHL